MTAAQQANAERLAKSAIAAALERRKTREAAALDRFRAVEDYMSHDNRAILTYIFDQLRSSRHDEDLLIERRNEILSYYERRHGIQSLAALEATLNVTLAA